VVVPVVKKKADMKASKAKAGGKKTKEKIAVQEDRRYSRDGRVSPSATGGRDGSKR
jgi:hypothetical protein